MSEKEIEITKTNSPIEGESELERQLRQDPFRPKRNVDMHKAQGATGDALLITPEEKQKWEDREEISLEKIKRHKSFAIASKLIAGIIVVVVIIAGVTIWRQLEFNQDRVKITVNAPTSMEAVQDVQFDINYENSNLVALNNAEIELYYPAGFMVSKMAPGMAVDGTMIRLKIGTIPRYGTGKLTLTGKFFGARDSLAYLKAILVYTPGNASTSIQVSSQASLALQASPLAIDIDTPVEIAAGSMVEYLVTATNTGDTSLPNMRLQITPPEGFVQSDQSPQSSEGPDVWYIGTIASHQKLSFRISGTLSGNAGERKSLKADFGVVQADGTFLTFAAMSRETRLTVSPLVIYQTVNGLSKLNVRPGDQLRYVMNYRNQGPTPLRNIVVTFEMHSDLFNLSQVQSEGGSYDATRRTVTWRVSDHPQLALLNPGDSGSIEFKVPLYETWSPVGAEAINPVLVTVAKVDSPDIPTSLGSNKIVASNRLSLPVVTVTGISVDLAKLTPPTGTTLASYEQWFTVHLKVNNTSNLLKGAQVKALFAPNVYWQANVTPAEEHVAFNDRTNEIVWDLGGVAANSGTVNPNREVSFQIKFTPAPNQIQNMGQNRLFNDRSIVLSATDAFTKDPLRVIYPTEIKVANAK